MSWPRVFLFWYNITSCNYARSPNQDFKPNNISNVSKGSCLVFPITTINSSKKFIKRTIKWKIAISIVFTKYMTFLDRDTVKKVALIQKYWLRYVGHIFIIWPHGQAVNNFSTYKNKRIHFTMELEQNNKLSFEDSLLIK